MKSGLNHISWFIALSVAVHAVVLLMWSRPEYNPGGAGHVVHLTMVESAGDITENNIIRNEIPQHVQTGTAGKSTHQPAKPSPDIQADKLIQAYGADLATSQPHDAPATDSTETAVQNTLASRSATPTNHERDRHLRNSIMKLITQRLTYPVIARKKGWQGIVILELHIESDGMISSLHVNQTSGYPVLDRAAKESLQLASIPHASKWLNGKAIDIVVPVEYRLLDT